MRFHRCFPHYLYVLFLQARIIAVEIIGVQKEKYASAGLIADMQALFFR